MPRNNRPKPVDSLRRRVDVRKPRKTIAVFCEGESTEPRYLEALKREPAVRDAAAVEIRIEPESYGSAPLTLVEMAAAARKRALKQGEEVDEFWCVFDVEWPKHHPNLDRAIKLAKDNEIRLAISNPCFELWLILHHRDQKAFLDNDGARRRRRDCDGQAGKSLDGAVYMGNRKDAVRRAVALERYHHDNRTAFPNDNPSSSFYRLVESAETNT